MLESGRIKTTTVLWKISGGSKELYEVLRGGADVEYVLSNHKAKAIRVIVEGNILLIEGINFIWRAVRGDAGLTFFNESNTYIGVGDGTTPESSNQTGLSGSNKYYKKVDSGYPTILDNRITFRATFNDNEANFTWNEWSVANGASDTAVNLNRKVETLGTKPQGAIWVLQVTLSIS